MNRSQPRVPNSRPGRQVGDSALSNYGDPQPAPRASQAQQEDPTQLGKEKGGSSELRTLGPVL